MRNFRKLLGFLVTGDLVTADYLRSLSKVGLSFLIRMKLLIASLKLFRTSLAKTTFIFFFLTLPYHISIGCGPYDIQFEGYSFINPNIVNTEAEYARYFLRFNDLSSLPWITLIRSELIKYLQFYSEGKLSFDSPNMILIALRKLSM